MKRSKNILEREVIEQKLQRLALEIAENLSGDDAPIILIGIRNSGLAVAEKIGAMLQPYLDVPVKIISMSFDKHLPKDFTLSEDVDFNDKNIILIDDVSNSGKTMLYALKPLLDYYPRRIQTLVLIERMHKLFPAKPDYVGLSLATTMQDHIDVEVKGSEITAAYIE